MSEHIIYTTKSILNFGKFKNKAIIELTASVEGRNYLIWMLKENFKMSMQLFQLVEAQHKKNKLANGNDYETDPKNYNSRNDDRIDSSDWENYQEKNRKKTWQSK